MVALQVAQITGEHVVVLFAGHYGHVKSGLLTYKLRVHGRFLLGQQSYWCHLIILVVLILLKGFILYNGFLK